LSRRDIDRKRGRRALEEWLFVARGGQLPPWHHEGRHEGRDAQGVPDRWLVIGGRGAGKTRLGAEWTHALARGFPPFSPDRAKYGSIALVGETFADAREVMIEGPSGIRAIARGAPPRYEATRRRLVWDQSGAVAHVFSAEDPESLRGPQFEAAWCDELAKWKHMEATFDMLQFGLRLGERPLQLYTTTPKPAPLIRRLLADPAVYVTRMATRDNAEHLSAAFLEAVEQRYGGTRLGRQELEGELVADRDDALWTRAMVETAGVREPRGTIGRIVVAVDPPAGAGPRSDACGIVAAGLEGEDGAVVLEDATLKRALPGDWAGAAVALYHRLCADCIVAEVNQGGDMVAAVIREVDKAVPVRPARAIRGKWLRAEPVAALYQQGRVRHAGRFPELEDEMCDFGPNGLSAGRSPDRLDALVWALTELLLGRRAAPRIRDFS
jgi:phage terminase large subunit-like protein